MNENPNDNSQKEINLAPGVYTAEVTVEDSHILLFHSIVMKKYRKLFGGNMGIHITNE